MGLCIFTAGIFWEYVWMRMAGSMFLSFLFLRLGCTEYLCPTWRASEERAFGWFGCVRGSWVPWRGCARCLERVRAFVRSCVRGGFRLRSGAFEKARSRTRGGYVDPYATFGGRGKVYVCIHTCVPTVCTCMYHGVRYYGVRTIRARRRRRDHLGEDKGTPRLNRCRVLWHDVSFTTRKGGWYTVGQLSRAQIVQFELFELILLLRLDKQFSIEQFEPTVSQSTVPPPLTPLRRWEDSIDEALPRAKYSYYYYYYY